MAGSDTFRDSTQIILPCQSLDSLSADVERKFAVTVVSGEEGCRVIGSPVEIKAVSEFLGRHGIAVQ